MRSFIITEQQAQTILAALGELPLKVGLVAANIIGSGLVPYEVPQTLDTQPPKDGDAQ